MFGKRLFRHLGIIPILITLLNPTIPAEAQRIEETFETSIVAETIAEDNETTIEDNFIVFEAETVIEESIEEETQESVIEETIAKEEETIPEETIVEKENKVEETVPEATIVEQVIFEEFVEEEEIRFNATNSEDMHKGRLTVQKGYVTDSPCGGTETWYPTAPGGAVQMLEDYYGFKDLKMTVREDGVRILQGFRPNGEWFEGLVIVAADVRDDNEKFQRNLDGLFNRGDIVETSLGTGIVVDYCKRAVNERKATGHIHIDIATTW